MRFVIQRVTASSVTVNNQLVSAIGHGYCVLVGLHESDTDDDLNYLAKKLLAVRLFTTPYTNVIHYWCGIDEASPNDPQGQLASVTSQKSLSGIIAPGSNASPKDAGGSGGPSSSFLKGSYSVISTTSTNIPLENSSSSPIVHSNKPSPNDDPPQGNSFLPNNTDTTTTTTTDTKKIPVEGGGNEGGGVVLHASLESSSNSKTPPDPPLNRILSIHIPNVEMTSNTFAQSPGETPTTAAMRPKNWSANIVDVLGSILLVSQFTLCHTMKGNKPDFHAAMKAQEAKVKFEKLVALVKDLYGPYGQERVCAGTFGAMMKVMIENDGPVTLTWDSKDRLTNVASSASDMSSPSPSVGGPPKQKK